MIGPDRQQIGSSHNDRAERASDRRIVLSYAPASAREGVGAMLALDDRLSAIVAAARDPMIGQMRLTWWHDALRALDGGSAPDEPVLQALARHVVPVVSGTELATLVEGWEELLDAGPLDEARLAAFGDARGGRLFVLTGRVLGAAPKDPLSAAGTGWALADLAVHLSDPTERARAAVLARELLAGAAAVRWSRRARALGAMAHLARIPDAAPPARAGRALWHRLTGR